MTKRSQSCSKCIGQKCEVFNGCNMKAKRDLLKKERGFTLIELLVVCAILGVLAVVVVPNVQSFMKKGSETAAIEELASVQTASDAYSAANAGKTANNVSDLSIYLRNTVKGTYRIEANGTVTQLTTGY